jgi:precorrin-6A/cobalt-precorrin-6A reductase
MILILGGTTEASALARLLAGRTDMPALMSLAGRTMNPGAQPIPTRAGGFGGASGLADFFAAKGVTAVVDATHPFAGQISANAALACADTGTPLLVLHRPPWRPQPGDTWTEVADARAAAKAIGTKSRRVFLTMGRLELPIFLDFPQHHYVVRTIDPPEALPPHAQLILARGPFDEAAELALLQHEKIEVVVTKNSGGAATYGKIAAARALHLPVILMRPPDWPNAMCVDTPEAALKWLEGVGKE